RAPGRGRDSEPARREIKNRTSLAHSARTNSTAPGMAHARDSGDAGIHSPPCRDRAGVEERRLAPNLGQTIAMVPGIALIAGTFHRHRPATGTHSFAG